CSHVSLSVSASFTVTHSGSQGECCCACPSVHTFGTIYCGGRMVNSFTLHEDAWVREGAVYAGGQVIGYRVGGMPDGKTARIANFGAPNRNDWRIMRVNADNPQSDWTGHYESVEDALAALQQDS